MASIETMASMESVASMDSMETLKSMDTMMDSMDSMASMAALESMARVKFVRCLHSLDHTVLLGDPPQQNDSSCVVVRVGGPCSSRIVKT